MWHNVLDRRRRWVTEEGTVQIRNLLACKSNRIKYRKFTSGAPWETLSRKNNNNIFLQVLEWNTWIRTCRWLFKSLFKEIISNIWTYLCRITACCGLIGPPFEWEVHANWCWVCALFHNLQIFISLPSKAQKCIHCQTDSTCKFTASRRNVVIILLLENERGKILH